MEKCWVESKVTEKWLIDDEIVAPGVQSYWSWFHQFSRRGYTVIMQLL